MTAHVWCHGPSCHKRSTTNRVRGSKGAKVLRTIKIALSSEYRRNSVWKYFCDQTCMHDFIYKHIEQFVQLHPRREPLETPIEDPEKKTYQSAYGDYSYTRTTINKIDRDSNVG